jgi:hypothetical protein
MSRPHTVHLGRDFRVRDCYVWAEIHYLDSPTDYREYLARPVVRAHARTRSEFAILDSWKHSSRRRTFLVVGVLVLCLVAFCLLVDGLLYL